MIIKENAWFENSSETIANFKIRFTKNFWNNIHPNYLLRFKENYYEINRALGEALDGCILILGNEKIIEGSSLTVDGIEGFVLNSLCSSLASAILSSDKIVVHKQNNILKAHTRYSVDIPILVLK